MAPQLVFSGVLGGLIRYKHNILYRNFTTSFARDGKKKTPHHFFILFFSLSPPNQTTTKNVIFPLFSPQLFILLKIPPNKHTLKVRIQTLDVTLQLEPFSL